jgi:diguanylate cyclase (GGDEF)-like protein/PAS domain S-box-containing protein
MNALLDRLDIGLIWLDAQARIQLCNAWLVQAAGLPAAPIGQSLEQALGSNIEPKLLRAVDEALRSGRSTRLSHAFHPTPLPLWRKRQAGGERLQQAVDVLRFNLDGASGCLIQVYDLSETFRREQLLKRQARQLQFDLGELRIAQDELTRQSSRLRELTRLAPVALFETDLEGHMLYCNERFLSLWSLRPPAAVMGRHWSAMLPPSDREALMLVWTELCERQGKLQRDVRIEATDGSERWLQLEASPLRNHDDKVFGYLATLIDVSSHYRRAQSLEHRAHHDALTGLPNREKLMQRLDSSMAAAKSLKQRVPLVFIDLDGFKAVNDQHGHGAGDALLKAVAQRMRRTLRGEDLVARLAGDEFALILADLPTSEQDHVARIMAKLELAIAEPFEHEGALLQVGCSWGCALYPDDADDANSLLMEADQRMYIDKRRRKSLNAESIDRA